MPTTNERGQRGQRIKKEGALLRWVLGSLGGAALEIGLFCVAKYGTGWRSGGFVGIGLVLLGGAWRAGPTRLTAHEKEVRAWEAEFPGLPWYMDDVKDSRQLDQWERARDYWEKTH